MAPKAAPASRPQASTAPKAAAKRKPRAAAASTRAAAPAPASAAPRRRRTAEEARTAILDAAERRLVEAGPSGIRLQEVASDVGVAHPTVLHHFGSREALVDAVVDRALGSLHEGLVAALLEAPEGEGQVTALLDGVHEALTASGHGRALLWLALAGYQRVPKDLRLREVVEAVHTLREARCAGGKQGAPPREDTAFVVVLGALTLLAQSVIGEQVLHGAGVGGDGRSQARFRAWLARLLIAHLGLERAPT